MSYGNYVIAAYLVFVVVLAWDFVAPRIQVRQQLRAARARAARQRKPDRNDLANAGAFVEPSASAEMTGNPQDP